MTLTKRQIFILTRALRYLQSNLDDANDAFCDDESKETEVNEEEVVTLIDVIGF